jgi:hypothetical protein
MSFDISRVTFDPWKDFSSVVMQQGRVQLDSDWNEWLAELTRRIRAGTLDIVGRAVYPATTPNAFLITPSGSSITIGAGRMYVDGLLAENHGLPAPSSGGWIPPNPPAPGPQPAWDPALDELVGQNAVAYEQQPYFPGVALQAPFPTQGGPFLIYLDVWQREITFLEAPDLIEKAVGVDTTGRWQTVWQVRYLDVSSDGNVTCSTKDSDIQAWDNLIQPSAGRLTTGVVQSSPSGVCCLAPNTGFTGMENQLYRVEIHQGSSSGTPTFKWSRNNASVATAVTGISPDRKTLMVQSTGKDNDLRFSKNDWVEITDDWLELNGQPGELHQVALVTDSANTITLSTAVTAGTFPVDPNNLTQPGRHTRLVKWNQQGKIFKSDGTTVWKDLDAAGTGDIPVPPPGTALILENGVTVSFDLNPTAGVFKVADYWNFAARTLDGTVENLVEAPPLGIHHHYARLAAFTPGQTPSDCRVEWPPATGDGGCDCASCVTAVSHNNGTWTIQQAIDAVLLEGGGKVCLGPGIYNIASAIIIAGNNNGPVMNLAICGHGLPTLAPTAQFQDTAIIKINDVIDLDIDYLAFSSGEAGLPAGEAASGLDVVAFAGVDIRQSIYVRIERCVFGLVSDSAQLKSGITLAGLIMDCTLRENLFTNIWQGVSTGALDPVLLRFAMENNQMFCTDGAVVLQASEKIAVALEVRFANNFVQSCSGFTLLAPGVDLTVAGNTFSLMAAAAGEGSAYGAAIFASLAQMRIANNDISRNAAVLTVSNSSTGGANEVTYTWVVTAILPGGREALLTLPALLPVSGSINATLQWPLLPGAKSYNVYRTKANAAALLLVGKADQGTGTTISFTDAVADANLNGALPEMQNDGIVLGSPNDGGFRFVSNIAGLYGTQVIANRINGLTGTGILSGTVLIETVIAQNQLLMLGGSGILLEACLDLDILGNSLNSTGLLNVQNFVAAIEIFVAINADISDNRIQQVGPTTLQGEDFRAGIVLLNASGARFSGNRIVDIGPTISKSAGIAAQCVGRLDVSDNEIRRASTPPAAMDQSIWLALWLIGDSSLVQGNVLESFGGPGNNVASGAVDISATGLCIFSNNQCTLDNPAGNQKPQIIVVQLTAASIVAMGNRLTGPAPPTPAPLGPSMLLNLPKREPLAATVIGNITSSGITLRVSNAVVAMPAAMAPLNVIA